MNENIFNEGNQIHNFMSSSGSGTVINYGSGSDFLLSYGSGYGSGSTCQKVTVPTVPVPVPQNVRFTKRQVVKTSGLQNVRLQKKHPYIYSVLVVGGNPQVLLQPCLQAN